MHNLRVLLDLYCCHGNTKIRSDQQKHNIQKKNHRKRNRYGYSFPHTENHLRLSNHQNFLLRFARFNFLLLRALHIKTLRAVKTEISLNLVSIGQILNQNTCNISNTFWFKPKSKIFHKKKIQLDRIYFQLGPDILKKRTFSKCQIYEKKNENL